MGSQETKFVKTEGDAWFFRNKDKPYNDVIGQAVRDCGLDLSHVDILEIGCGRGDCIGSLQPKTEGVCIGIDPSHQAIVYAHSRYPGVDFRHGVARSLPAGHDFDIIIYSFCLYLCDREELFEIVLEGDDVLRDRDSRLIIHDFDPDNPHKIPYHHVPGLFSYKQDYSKLWLANPAYSLVSKAVMLDGTAIWTLKKDIEAGWPLESLK